MFRQVTTFINVIELRIMASKKVIIVKHRYFEKM